MLETCRHEPDHLHAFFATQQLSVELGLINRAPCQTARAEGFGKWQQGRPPINCYRGGLLAGGHGQGAMFQRRPIQPFDLLQ